MSEPGRKELTSRNLAKRTHEKLVGLSMTDPLTGLPNSRALEKHIAALESDRSRHLFSGQEAPQGTFLAIDLTKLKEVNDVLGRSVGNEYLKLTVEAVKESIRPTDWAFRLSNEADEITIHLPGVTGSEDLEKIMDRIDAKVSEKEDKIKTLLKGRHMSVSSVAVRYAKLLGPSEANKIAHDKMGEAKALKQRLSGIRGEKVARLII